ncbi:peptidase M48 [Hypericibacter terrae]|uniref:Peptidase M48 n=1 Tax=Hypericibacter terrae TaxID=2602015 RepID=A0A5J6MFE2_9PROT|nr:peptidase M48 [Hypericibacter terrae]
MRIMRFLRSLVTLVAAWFAFAPSIAVAADGPSLVRDAEIEAYLRDYTTPIFVAAGLDPASIHIYIVNDPRINAFVAGGMNLFLHTGLLVRAQTANQVIGVIAHETGHIAGGHLVRSKDVQRAATIESIIAMVLGIGAGIASGQPGAAGAGVLVGPGVATTQLLKYTRTQEASADSAGLGFLDATGQTARGMYEMFDILQKDAVLTGFANENPFLQTHPMTQQRMDHIQQFMASSPFTNAPLNPQFEEDQRRIRAKIVAFMEPLDDIMKAYPENDTSFAARYARAIAWYRAADLAKATPAVDQLILEEPNNPYLKELKGQMLFENGHTAESVEAYRQAVKLAPDSPLLRIGLAQSLVETNDATANGEAIQHLEVATGLEPANIQGWRLLTVAYGRNNQLPMVALAQAEIAMLQGQDKKAKEYARRAQDGLPPGSPGALRAEDILFQVSQDQD